MPSIVKFAGYEANTPQEAVHTWILQRFGQDPLDPNKLVSQLDIRDGETLHLRQRENAMPDAAFDDVVDAVTTTAQSRPSWQPRHSQQASIVTLALVLVGVPLLLVYSSMQGLVPADIWLPVALICLLISFGSTITSIALSRAVGEFKIATTYAWIAVVLAAIAGWFMLGSDTPTALRLVMSSSLVLAVSMACALAASVTQMGLITAATVNLIVLLASAADTLLTDATVQVAGVTGSLMLLVAPVMPMLSYRIAQIAMPPLPPTAEAMLADDEPIQSDIVTRALLADKLLASGLAASSIVAVLSCMVMLSADSWWAPTLAACIGLSLLLRARAYVGLTQRASLLVGGLIITFGSVLRLARYLPSPLLIGIVLALVFVIAAIALSIYGTVQYAKNPSPSLGRVGDILEWIALIAVVPLLMGVPNLYMVVRALIG